MLEDSSFEAAHGSKEVLIGEGDDRRARWGHPEESNSLKQYIALQRLTRMRYHLVHNLTREKQYFLQNLFYKCNAFRSEVDSSVFGHAIMEMLSEKFSLDDIANMDVTELADYLKEKGKNRFPDPDHVARCIQKAARASYRLSKVIEDSIDLVLGTSIQAIRSIQSQLKELDKAIERILAGIPGAQCLRSIPGIDRAYAAGILAEIGDIDRFSDQAAVAKYAGLSWRRHQSGGFEAEDTKRIRSGNRFLRYYLVEAANSVKNYFGYCNGLTAVYGLALKRYMTLR